MNSEDRKIKKSEDRQIKNIMKELEGFLSSSAQAEIGRKLEGSLVSFEQRKASEGPEVLGTEESRARSKS